MANIKVDNKPKVLKELADLRYKKGYSRLSMINYLKENYGLKQTSCYEYIKEMLQQTAEAYNKTTQDALSDSVSFLEKLREKALKDGNNKLALEISKEINKVNQLHVQKLALDKETIDAITINIKKKDEN
jgi:GTPase Era involved in 16S rRNA processing